MYNRRPGIEVTAARIENARRNVRANLSIDDRWRRSNERTKLGGDSFVCNFKLIVNHTASVAEALTITKSNFDDRLIVKTRNSRCMWEKKEIPLNRIQARNILLLSLGSTTRCVCQTMNVMIRTIYQVRLGRALPSRVSSFGYLRVNRA